MKAIIENYTGQELEIEIFFSQLFKGRGAWSINCEVSYKGHKKTFHSHTTDSMLVDKIADMRAEPASWNKVQEAYKEKFFDSLKEVILEWCEEINEK